MDIRPLGIEGAWAFTPRQFRDDRGVVLEWYRHEGLAEHVGHPLDLRQANCSVSSAGTLRGVHFADVPPGQAKYVTCVRGAVVDVVVDVRVGSPTFGAWEAVRLDETDRTAVYLSEGLGHAFAALTDDATVVYLCSKVYTPAAEHGITPLDPDLAVDWASFGVGQPLLSPKDAAAPTLAQARDSGLLPRYVACLERRRALAARSGASA
ncbi:dTDP-4-dehydrorhamnose 3,5-epimerase family protein [Kineosporia sp. A_224]|uniref:dTDP-4-dehydrorhamnose 3,5-epimerase family protein n=1 Tax=Kineosporia sp. A_224 TaxID=1962180 RepID=UPI0018EA052E|nr:dTDP-4-dehydrorhamnose 3,5-epimerase [Kineosporia sp. A_224]